MSVDNDDRMMEVFKQMSQLQEKYTFYVVALCVSAIGFSVYCTMGKPLHWTHISLGIAVLSWAVSIYSGLKYIEVTINIKFHNFKKLEASTLPQTTDQIDYQYFRKMVDESIKSYTKKSNLYTNIQEYSFYSGVLCFIIWHVIEMSMIK